MTAINQLINHALFENHKSAFSLLKNLESNDDFLESLNEYGLQTFNRTQGIMRILGKNINGIDPILFRKSLLDQINTEINNLKSLLTNGHFKHDQHLNTINQKLDIILTYLSQTIVLVDESSISTVRNTVTSLRKSVGVQKSIIDRQTKKLEEQANVILTKTEEIETTLNDFDSQIETKKREIDEKYDELHQNFIAMQEKRSESFIELKEKFTTDFNNYSADFKDRAENSSESFEEQFKKYKENLDEIQNSFNVSTLEKQRIYDSELQQHKSAVEELVGIVSTSAISSHFKEVADYKRKTVNRWQFATIAGFLITIIFGVYTFVFQQGVLDTYNLIARSIVTLALGSFTGYAARQVTKNEADEKYNRDMEVELKTLNPYIASLNPADQEELKKLYFSKIFTRENIIKGEQEIDANTLENES